jgi:hypothetical protein
MTEADLKAMNYAQFEQWVQQTKSANHKRYAHLRHPRYSLTEVNLRMYKSWQNWFAGEMTGYSSSERRNKPCSITFFATDNRQYTLNKAIAYAKKAYEERTQSLTERLQIEKSRQEVTA